MFLNLKNTLFCTQFSSQNAGNHILGLWNFKIFRGSMPQTPSRDTGLMAPCWQLCWYSQVLYSNLLATSIIIETPVDTTFYWTEYIKLARHDHVCQNRLKYLTEPCIQRLLTILPCLTEKVPLSYTFYLLMVVPLLHTYRQGCHGYLLSAYCIWPPTNL